MICPGKRILALCLMALVFCAPMVLYAQEESQEEVEVGETKEGESEQTDEVTSATWVPENPRGFFAYIFHVEEKAASMAEMDDVLWGPSTRSVPKNMLRLDLIINPRTTDSRYTDDGDFGDYFTSQDFNDPFGSDEMFYHLKTNVEGEFEGYDLKATFGINDPIDIFLYVPLQKRDMRLETDFTPGTSAILGVRTLDQLYDLYELFGRPRPAMKYKSKSLEMGDLVLGTSWNFYRNDIFSAKAEGRITLPTGKRADPNQALVFGLGPQVDIGTGSYAPGVSYAMDVRPPLPWKLLILSMDLDYDYRIKGMHRAPRYLKPNTEVIEAMPDMPFFDALFPDLSDLDDFYYVTPGSKVHGRVMAFIDGVYVIFGLGYDHTWEAEPVVDANLEAFEKMLDALGSYREMELRQTVAQIELPLYQLKIPAHVKFEAYFPIYGRNDFRFENQYRTDVGVYIPF